MKKFFKNSGFTLFELLAVLAILAIVAGIAVPRVMQTITNSRIQALEAEMQLVASAVQRMLMEEVILETEIELPFYIYLGDSNDAEDIETLMANASETDVQGVAADVETQAYDYSTEVVDIGLTLSVEDYLDGSVPDYLMVLVYDKYNIDETSSGEAEILVVYDETVLSNYGNISAVSDNISPVLKSVEYEGTNLVTP